VIRRFATTVLLIVALTTLTRGQPPLSAGEIAKLIESELTAAHVPGAAIAVVSGDDMLARGIAAPVFDACQRQRGFSGFSGFSGLRSDQAGRQTRRRAPALPAQW